MAGENLTLRQIAYLRRLWLIHQPGAIERRYKIMLGVAGSITILLFATSIFGIVNEWSSVSLWMLGLLAGIFESGVLRVVISKKRWQIVEPFVDWERIEAIATSSENN